MRVPAEINAIMWSIAESSNTTAAEDFVKRYPAYADELNRRMKTVSGLRQSRGVSHKRSHSIPHFTPTAPRPQLWPRAQVTAVAVLGLAAIAAASYTFVMFRAPSVPTPVEKPAPIVREVPTTTARPNPERTKPVMESRPAIPEPDTTHWDHSEATPPPLKPVDRFGKPQSLTIRQTTLHNAIHLLGLQSGLRVEIASGLANPVINADYRNMTGFEILQDLGQKYRFTPFDQGDGVIVVYPGVDGATPGDPSGQGSTRRIGG